MLLFAMLKSVVKLFKVPVVEVVAARLSNESALLRACGSRWNHTLIMSFLVVQPVFCLLPGPRHFSPSHYHLILPLLMTVVICCTSINFLNQFFTCPSVFQGNSTHPSNHLHLCSFKLLPLINRRICCSIMAGIYTCRHTGLPTK